MNYHKIGIAKEVMSGLGLMEGIHNSRNYPNIAVASH
jgi:hypothetical protein